MNRGTWANPNALKQYPPSGEPRSRLGDHPVRELPGRGAKALTSERLITRKKRGAARATPCLTVSAGAAIDDLEAGVVGFAGVAEGADLRPAPGANGLILPGAGTLGLLGTRWSGCEIRAHSRAGSKRRRAAAAFAVVSNTVACRIRGARIAKGALFAALLAANGRIFAGAGTLRTRRWCRANGDGLRFVNHTATSATCCKSRAGKHRDPQSARGGTGNQRHLASFVLLKLHTQPSSSTI